MHNAEILELVDEWLQNLSELHMTQNTLNGYKSDVMQLLELCNGDVSDHMKLMEWHLFVAKMKPSTYNRKMSCVRNFLNWMVKRGLLDESVKFIMVDGKVKPDLQYGILEHNLVQNAIMNAQMLALEEPTVQNLQNVVALQLLYELGMRVDEIAELKSDHVLLDYGYILVHGDMVKMGQLLQKNMAVLLQMNDKWVLKNRSGKPWSQSALYRFVKSQLGHEASPSQLRIMAMQRDFALMTYGQILEKYGVKDGSTINAIYDASKKNEVEKSMNFGQNVDWMVVAHTLQSLVQSEARLSGHADIVDVHNAVDEALQEVLLHLKKNAEVAEKKWNKNEQAKQLVQMEVQLEQLHVDLVDIRNLQKKLDWDLMLGLAALSAHLNV